MTQLLGEYDCKLDSKGRVLFPSGLRKQLHPEVQDRFVVNRGFEECLSLYPYDEWQNITREIDKLNLYVEKNRKFVRYFYRGATELQLDSNSRLLLPKKLLEWADIEKTVVLFAYANRVEIWDKDKYENLLTDEPEDFADLAEEVMGNPETPQDENNNDRSEEN
jgi:MraZ protein